MTLREKFPNCQSTYEVITSLTFLEFFKNIAKEGAQQETKGR